MNTVIYRLEMTTNSAARALDGDRKPFGVDAVKCKHNGGKIVLVEVRGEDSQALCDEINAAHNVSDWT